MSSVSSTNRKNMKQKFPQTKKEKWPWTWLVCKLYDSCPLNWSGRVSRLSPCLSKTKQPISTFYTYQHSTIIILSRTHATFQIFQKTPPLTLIQFWLWVYFMIIFLYAAWSHWLIGVLSPIERRTLSLFVLTLIQTKTSNSQKLCI